MTPLRRRMTDDMQIRNLSPNTQESYISYVQRFARHFGQSPERLGPEQIRDYQVFMATRKQLSPSAINVATAALRFLYRVTLGRDCGGQPETAGRVGPGTRPGTAQEPAEGRAGLAAGPRGVWPVRRSHNGSLPRAP